MKSENVHSYNVVFIERDDESCDSCYFNNNYCDTECPCLPEQREDGKRGYFILEETARAVLEQFNKQ